MGKADDGLRDFINNIPDSKLTGFPEKRRKIYFNQDFRLDMQCVSNPKEGL